MPRALNLVFWFKVKPSEEISFSLCKASFGWRKRSERLQGTDMALGLPSCQWSWGRGEESSPSELVSGALWQLQQRWRALKTHLLSCTGAGELPQKSTRKFCVLKTRGRRSNPSWPSIILGFLFRQAPAVEKLNQRIRFRKPYPPVPGPDLFKGSCSDVKMK